MSINFLELPEKSRETGWILLAVGAMSFFVLHSLWFEQSLIVYTVMMLLATIAIFRSPFAGLITIMICTMWFERHFTLQSLYVGAQIYKFYPLDAIIGLTAMSTITRLLNREYSWSWKKFDAWIIGFIGLCTIAYIRSFYANIDADLAFGTYKNYALYAVVFFLITCIVRRDTDWQKFMQWFTVGGIGLFFFVIYGLVTGEGLWSEFTPLSTPGDRLIAGTHAFYAVLFGIWLFSYYVFHKGISKTRQLGIEVALLIVGIALFISLVRHLWLALFILSIVWIILLPKENRSRLVGFFGKLGFVVAVLAVIYIGLLSFLGVSATQTFGKSVYIVGERASIGSVAQLGDTSFRWRVSAWRAGLYLLTSNPLIGAGFGYTVEGYDEITPFSIPLRDLHNNYLGILIQLGIMGFAFVVLWFLYLLRVLVRTWRMYVNRDPLHTVWTFTSGSILVLFMIVFSISVYWDVNLFIVWWWISLGFVRFLYYKKAQALV